MQPGFAIIHANRLETLLDAVLQRCRAEPLAPLEEEIFLVQSNGMADWLKLQMASATGISMSARFPMPASYLWELYRQVLTPDTAATANPFAKDSLQWRLLRLLPPLLQAPDFARPARFLDDDIQGVRLFQLARKLADLFDQYQLYRADWLLDWEAGKRLGLGEDENWQARLWCALLDDLPTAERHLSRAHLHRAFLEAMQKSGPPRLPRRIFLFGINSLSAQLLEALHALAPHCQLLLMVLNPSAELWSENSRDSASPNHPLLDQWGGLGRDFQRLLLAFTPETKNANEYALFEDTADTIRLPQRIQQAMLENLPLAQVKKQPLPSHPGLSFFPAWSRQREVEVLHDRLLDLFAKDPALNYTDVVVMMPNVDVYSAHIEAVFNRYPATDPRHLDFAISDRHAAIDQPLFQAASWLAELPAKRITRSEVLFLLSVPALRRAFNLTAADVELVQDWIDLTHTRWGLDGAHKHHDFQLPALDNNTWRAGLDQLLAGYCAGNTAAIPGVTLDEVSANQGEVLGRFCELIDALTTFKQALQHPLPPLATTVEATGWNTLFGQLLTHFFQPTDDTELTLFNTLQDALAAWLADCDSAAFNAPLPLMQARSGWLDKVRMPGLSQQLSFHGITFCTLMPMRALPFRHVFLLGMNDGDYPREQLAPDFDLMQVKTGSYNHFRPGDRNRRDDDQYLFLEALLSVRDSLHISWVGKNIQNKRIEPASVLVEQLKDHVDACWTTDNDRKASEVLTLDYPLAPFSRRYFERDGSNPRTHAREWFSLYVTADASTQPAQVLPAPEPNTIIELWQLAALLKQPANVFYTERLGVFFRDQDDNSDDDEPFALNPLACWQLRNALLHANAVDAPLKTRYLASGELPAGAFSEYIYNTEAAKAENIRVRWQAQTHGVTPLPPRLIRLMLTGSTPRQLDCVATHLWQQEETLLRVEKSASNLHKNNQWKVDKLAAAWVHHLALCASGQPVESHLIALDRQITWTALDAATATAHLRDLASLHDRALQAPLPVTPFAALTWLDQHDRSRVETAFKTHDQEHPAVAQSFAVFDDLWPATDGLTFTALAETLYAPLWRALKGDSA